MLRGPSAIAELLVMFCYLFCLQWKDPLVFLLTFLILAIAAICFENFNFFHFTSFAARIVMLN